MFCCGSIVGKGIIIVKIKEGIFIKYLYNISKETNMNKKPTKKKRHRKPHTMAQLLKLPRDEQLRLLDKALK